MSGCKTNVFVDKRENTLKARILQEDKERKFILLPLARRSHVQWPFSRRLEQRSSGTCWQISGSSPFLPEFSAATLSSAATFCSENKEHIIDAQPAMFWQGDKWDGSYCWNTNTSGIPFLVSVLHKRRSIFGGDNGSKSRLRILRQHKTHHRKKERKEERKKRKEKKRKMPTCELSAWLSILLPTVWSPPSNPPLPSPNLSSLPEQSFERPEKTCLSVHTHNHFQHNERNTVHLLSLEQTMVQSQQKLWSDARNPTDATPVDLNQVRTRVKPIPRTCHPCHASSDAATRPGQRKSWPLRPNIWSVSFSLNSPALLFWGLTSLGPCAASLPPDSCKNKFVQVSLSFLWGSSFTRSLNFHNPFFFFWSVAQQPKNGHPAFNSFPIKGQMIYVFSISNLRWEKEEENASERTILALVRSAQENQLGYTDSG